MNMPPELKKSGEQVALEGHLRLLRMFYYILAGFSLVGLFFLFGHYYLMTHFIQMAASAPVKPGKQVDPLEVMMIFRWFYIAFGCLMIVGGVLNLLTAQFLGERRYRMFCLVVGGINCLQFPFGTVLGVFTIVVLMKPEAEEFFGPGAD